MAVVSFTIAAIDKTRAAFASVNQGLRNINTQTKQVNGGVIAMGLRFAGLGTVIGGIAGRVRYLNENFNEITGIPKSAVDSVDMLAFQTTYLRDKINEVILGYTHGLPAALQLAIYQFDVLTKGEEAAALALVDRERKTEEMLKRRPEYMKAARIETDKLAAAQRELAQVTEGKGISVTRRRNEALAMEEKARVMGDEIEKTKLLTEAVNLRTAAERDFQTLAGETATLTKESAAANGRLMGSSLSLTDRIDGLKAAWSAAAQEVATYSDLTNPYQLEKRNEAIKKMVGITNELAKANLEVDRRAADAANVLTRGFEDAVFAGEGLRESIRGIGNDLMRYVFQQLITRPLGNFITGGISSMFGFGGPRAAGGPVGGGSSYLVGEHGPELFTPSQAGRIIPNHATGQSTGGSAGNTYVIDARGTDESVVMRLSSALMQLAGPGVVERRAINATTNRNARRAFAT